MLVWVLANVVSQDKVLTEFFISGIPIIGYEELFSVADQESHLYVRPFY